jgi:4-amino-4-deoxy-L-arabinose transferase-like glycosyltransferase
MGRKLTAVAFVLLTLLPLARVAATWHVFSRTVDEPAHVGAGREWLEKGTYQRDVEHPPLARVLEAIASRLGGGGDEVIRARAGNLPFLLIALIVVAMWTARLFGNAAALIALALFGALATGARARGPGDDRLRRDGDDRAGAVPIRDLAR